MTLGELIDTLRDLPPASLITLDSGEPVADIDSYRGYYEDLALEPGDRDDATVGQLLALAEERDGATLQGYKGGDFLMTRDTRLWVASWGETSRRIPTGVRRTHDGWAITTADIEDYA